MTQDGFICLFRQFKEWQHYQENSVKSVFLDLLLSVSYEAKWFRGEKIKRGCTAMSITALQESTGLSRSVVVKALKILEKTGEISRFKSKFGIITKINKFSEFQGGKKVGSSKNEPPSEPVSEPVSEPASELYQQINNKTNKQDNIYNINNNITPSNEGESVGTDPPPGVDLNAIVDFFNKSVMQSNSLLPKIKGASGKRVGYIRARIREYGLDAVYEVITKATQSDFLNGKNQRGWTASFDWIFLPTNFPKVLEGNYDNRPQTIIQNGTANNQPTRDPRDAERQHLANGYAAAIARLAAEDDARASGVRRP